MDILEVYCVPVTDNKFEFTSFLLLSKLLLPKCINSFEKPVWSDIFSLLTSVGLTFVVQRIVAPNPWYKSFNLFFGVIVDWCSNLRVCLSPPNYSSWTRGVCFSKIFLIFFICWFSFCSYIEKFYLWPADKPWEANLF